LKAKNKNKTCPEALSNECIVWQGGDVPALGICNGDELSLAEKIIADKVVELIGAIDVSKTDISCLVGICTDCEDKSLKSLIQLLFDNQCSLRDLINSSGSSTSSIDLKINLRCLKKFDDFGNEIPQDLNAALQSVVNQVCTSKDKITGLEVKISDLQNQIDAIPAPSTQTEPNITTCLTPGLKPVSQVVPLFAQDYCTYKSLIGNDSEISQALSQQCENLNTEYQTNEGWNLTVDNLSKTISNMWIVICDLKSRIRLIEDNCCKVTCEDIKIGFDIILNSSGDSVNLKFTSKAGTVIPNGFTDCGSIVTITDKAGNSVQYNLEVANNADEGEFFITGLDTSSFLSFEVTAKLCAEGISCEKCASKLFNPNNSTCPYCEVTVTGDPGSEVVIVYQEI
jgi:archaellum component FlaC